MIDVKKAVEIARNHYLELYPDVLPSRLSLEEVELSDDENYWYITLGYSENSPISPVLPQVTKYKTIKIDAASGKPLSMKIRILS
ncbi:hypothetical protein HYR54_12445 [Candidatus Acetothermia bacterium]|nr:hypothetical protein [Candidatus Acetothermia bacterium]